MTGHRSAAEVAKNLKRSPVEPAATTQQVQIDPQTRRVVDDLFERLKAIFSAWKQSWPTDVELNAAKREWLAEFMRAGIRQMAQIQHGMRTAAQQRTPFVPTPGVFVSWCFAPEAFGLPVLERAYAQALRNTHPAQAGCARWSHPAVYHAAVATGFFSLQRLERPLGLKRFEDKYLDQCRKLGRGEVLAPAPIAALPAPEKPRSPEVANAALAALRMKIGGGRG